VKSGILPQNIAVVLPDENFSSILKEFDSLNNLNFAMGFKMKYSAYCQRLQAVLKRMKENEPEHIFRLFRLGINEDDIKDLHKTRDAQSIVSQLRSFVRKEDMQEEKDIIENELFLFEKFLQGGAELDFEQAAMLFLKRIEIESVYDNMGGKVTVMGVLESRGAKYDGVIIVDFNDDVVPKRSSKDMFISSLVRSKSNLPSTEDRENLQRFFYDRLINNAKMVAICCVENEEKLPSRFLKSLSLTKEEVLDEAYGEILFSPSRTKNITEKNFVFEYNFFAQPLSSSRLKTYLECPRRYFLKYIKCYEEAFIPNDICNARYMGIALHEMLKELFEKQLSNIDDFKKVAKELIKAKIVKNMLWELESDIWLKKLETFFSFEIERAKDGWEIFSLEKNITRNVNGFNLTGIIDRIDKKGEKYLLLDYKTGKIPLETNEKKALESSDFQLEFYSFLCKDLGDMKAAFYDLNNALIVENEYFELRKEKLLEHLLFLKQNSVFSFDKTEDKKRCRFCHFSKLCGNFA
jgi:hypothetical protein